MYRKHDMRRYHMLQFKDTDVGHLWHYTHRGKLDYMYEQMAIVGSMDVVDLPTISPDTIMFLTRDDFPNHSNR